MRLIQKLINDPTKLFLVDGVGAWITAALTVVLTQFESYIGMPNEILRVLAVIAFTYSIYSLSCYRLKPQRWKPYLKAIMIANALYCSVTLALLTYFYQRITALGFVYFVSEVIIVCVLLRLEYKVLSKEIV
jgi:hypothetical protein